MARCLACGNTETFRCLLTEYSVSVVTFDAQGNVVQRINESAQSPNADTWPWTCDVCDSDNVEVPDDVAVV